MIDASHRFHGQGSLRFVYAKGRTVRAGTVSLRYIFNSRETAYRAAVVVSRKVNKSAVVRNRVRRRIYEIIRKNAELITEPYDLIFTVYGQEVAEMPHAALSQLIISQLTQAGVIAPIRGSAPEAKRGIVGEKETNP